MLYVVVLPQHRELFASLAEAQLAAQRFNRYFSEMCGENPHVRPEVYQSAPYQRGDLPLEAGPGQERCRRIQRRLAPWWAAYWAELSAYYK